MNLDKSLIAGCLADPEILIKARRAKIKPHHLEDGTYKYLYRAMLEVEKEEPPTPKVVKKYILMDENRSKDKKKALIRKVDSLTKQGKEGAHLTISKLKEMRVDRDLTGALLEATGKMKNAEDSAEVLPELMARLKEIKESDGGEYEIFYYHDDWDTRKVERIELNQGSDRTMKMILNLNPFSRYFVRGIQPEEVTAIGGPTYAGKSVLLSNFIRCAAHPENGFNVLYIFAENRKVQAASRLDAIILGREYDELYEQELQDEEGDQFFKQATEDGWGEIVMAKVTPRKFTSATIREMVEEIGQRGIDIDVIAIDSPDHQVPEELSDSWWQDKGRVYWDNKALAEEFEVMILCTLPMKASSVKKESVTSEDAGGSYDISRICDNMIMFNLDPADRLLNRGKLQVTKARDGTTDNKILHFYFENNHRLLPWDEVFHGEVEAGIEADDEAVFKIQQFKDREMKRVEFEEDPEMPGFNIRKGSKKAEEADG